MYGNGKYIWEKSCLNTQEIEGIANLIRSEEKMLAPMEIFFYVALTQNWFGGEFRTVDQFFRENGRENMKENYSGYINHIISYHII